MVAPTGCAPSPPDWLADHPLPIIEIPAGAPLYRVHRSGMGAIFFGPGGAAPPVNRFDSAAGLFGVLYLGQTFEAAFVETILRNPQRRMVRQSDLTTRSHCSVTPRRPLRMTKMFDDGLAQIGTDNAISTGPYEPCGAWSDALWLHRDLPDGIAYRSRHDSGQLCFAVFARADLDFSVSASERLDGNLAVIGALLDRYGKSLDQDS